MTNSSVTLMINSAVVVQIGLGLLFEGLILVSKFYCIFALSCLECSDIDDSGKYFNTDRDLGCRDITVLFDTYCISHPETIVQEIAVANRQW